MTPALWSSFSLIQYYREHLTIWRVFCIGWMDRPPCSTNLVECDLLFSLCLETSHWCCHWDFYESVSKLTIKDYLRREHVHDIKYPSRAITFSATQIGINSGSSLEYWCRKTKSLFCLFPKTEEMWLSYKRAKHMTLIPEAMGVDQAPGSQCWFPTTITAVSSQPVVFVANITILKLLYLAMLSVN